MTEAPDRITVEDLRRKALRVRDVAEAEARHVAEERATQVAVIGVVALVALVSLAYYLGSRRR